MEMALVFNSAAALAIAFLLAHLYKTVWLKSETMRRKLRMQGIKGPPPSILYGNLPEMQKIQSNATKPASTSLASDIVAHDYTSTLFPYFEQWRKEYGKLPFLPQKMKKKKKEKRKDLIFQLYKYTIITQTVTLTQENHQQSRTVYEHTYVSWLTRC